MRRAGSLRRLLKFLGFFSSQRDHEHEELAQITCHFQQKNPLQTASASASSVATHEEIILSADLLQKQTSKQNNARNLSKLIPRLETENRVASKSERAHEIKLTNKKQQIAQQQQKLHSTTSFDSYHRDEFVFVAANSPEQLMLRNWLKVCKKSSKSVHKTKYNNYRYENASTRPKSKPKF